jgi:hypothetical protein
MGRRFTKWFDDLILRHTQRIWNRHIAAVLCRHYAKGTINSRQLHELAKEFDPTQHLRLPLRSLLVAALLGLLLATPAAAQTANVVLTWIPDPSATTHLVQQTVNPTATPPTWSSATLVGSVTCTTATPPVCTATVSAPSTGLVLFRITDTNAQGSTTRTNAGPWYNGSWAVPVPASATGIQ